MARKGVRIPIDVQSRVLIGDGQVVGVTSIARDLSERDRLENELRQAQKMEAVGRLATGIAHDFNNLITVLLGYSDELIEMVPEGSEQLRAASEIRRAAERASGLTQQLLAFSRRQITVAQTVDLNATVANMQDLVRRLIGPEIRLEFTPGHDLKNIRGDAAQIGQVVMNLAVNARDAMPLGGALQIETANVELGAENIDVIPGPHVMLAVRDSGVGMTHEVRKQLFEPFFTTKESGHGTGLGLSMVHAIVRQNGGHVMVESAPGEGSTFRCLLPESRRSRRCRRCRSPMPPHVSTVTGAGVVLLAEDDPSVRRLVSTELERRGFTVIVAEDGRAALETVHDSPGSHRSDRHRRRDAAHERRRPGEGGGEDSSRREDPLHFRTPGARRRRTQSRGSDQLADEAVHRRHAGHAHQGAHRGHAGRSRAWLTHPRSNARSAAGT